MQGLTAAALAHGLSMALCTAFATTAAAQDDPLPLDRLPYACVDPADATARRWLQREPCRLPLYHLPVAGAAAWPESPLRAASLPARPERGRGHAMFWRLPVQPRGPYEAPRNSWR